MVQSFNDSCSASIMGTSCVIEENMRLLLQKWLYWGTATLEKELALVEQRKTMILLGRTLLLTFSKHEIRVSAFKISCFSAAVIIILDFTSTFIVSSTAPTVSLVSRFFSLIACTYSCLTQANWCILILCFAQRSIFTNDLLVDPDVRILAVLRSELSSK